MVLSITEDSIKSSFGILIYGNRVSGTKACCIPGNINRFASHFFYAVFTMVLQFTFPWKVESIAMTSKSYFSVAPAFMRPGGNGIRHIRLMLLLIPALWIASATSVQASDPIGVYAVVDKVVLEPDDKNPERIQVWGAFCFAEGRGDNYGPAKRGYLYYKVDPAKPEVSRKEWNDLKELAGTKQVVAFGSRRTEKGRVRKPDDKAEAPDTYPLGFGLQKIRENHWNAQPVKALRALTSTASVRQRAFTRAAGS